MVLELIKNLEKKRICLSYLACLCNIVLRFLMLSFNCHAKLMGPRGVVYCQNLQIYIERYRVAELAI